MKINTIELIISAVRESQYPTDQKKEFLLVGRSNVGKSSFINSIINRKNYARTSATPGKTQTLNFYKINDEFYLVDAPGYGFAKVRTKVDKVSKNNHQKNKNVIVKELNLNNENDIILFSSITKTGKNEVYDEIEKYL